MDFSYGNKVINASGPIKPSDRNMPGDPRTRVEVFADIANIPTPYVGMTITVLQDETNDNKMTEYKVKSLKANSFGVANSLVDEVVRYVDYLGAASGGGSSSGGASVEIVNDLTTGGANKALSAEQGKVIKSSLDTITTRIDGLELGGNLVLRDVVDGEIFTLDTGTTPTVTYGNIVLSTTTLSVNENANTTFTVKLDKAPTNNQVINIVVNNGYCTVNPTTLTFTPSNYSTTQTVTVNGVHDSSHYSAKTSVITLSSSNVSSKTINVTINNIDSQPSTPDPTISVQSISLNKTESTLNVNDTEQLTVTFNPTNATNQNVTWSSSDNTKATVVNGLVTGVASGNATITATSEDGNKSATCSYTIQEVESGGESDASLKMFLNAEGGSERYDNDNCLIWLDQSGNGKNYKFVQNGSKTNEELINYLWSSDRFFAGSSGVINFVESPKLNNNSGLTSLNFTWDIKIKYVNTSQMVLIGNGTPSINASYAFAITTQAGNIIVRGNYDKIAIVNPLSTTLTVSNFYRITVTNDSSTCKLYLDGEFITSCDSSTFTSIQKGVLHTVPMDYSYIKYYDRALSETEIKGGVE